MSSDVLALSYYEHESFQDLENASVTAQRDHSHCPHAPKSADARTLAHGLLAWGWVRWLVFGDFHVEWEWHGLKNRLLLFFQSKSADGGAFKIQLMRVRLLHT